MFDYRFTPPVLEYVSLLEPEDRAFILRCVLDICGSPQVDNETTFEIEVGGFTQRIRDFGDYFILFDIVTVAGDKFIAIYDIGR